MAVTVTGTGITFNDSTTQTTAYVAGGGVTSVNSQTGAVVTTSVDSIGSTVWGANCSTSNYYTGQTIAGSSLRYISAITSTYSNLIFTEGSFGSNPSTSLQNDQQFRITRGNSGNTGFVNPGGTTALSGTYRCMSISLARYTFYDSMCNGTSSYASLALWIRVS
jgi:hypothetical protein